MSAVIMASQNPWENVDELPSKLNKFKRYLAKRHQEQQQQEQQTAAAAAAGESPLRVSQSIGASGNNRTTADFDAQKQHYLNGNVSITSNGNIPNESLHLLDRDAGTDNCFSGYANHSDVRTCHNETSDVPLNLSLSSTRYNMHATSEYQYRPTSHSHQGHGVCSPPSSASSPPPPLVMDVDDNYCVDEHFQRSLGSIYMSLQGDRSSPSTLQNVTNNGYSPPGVLIHDKCSSDRAQSVPDTQSHGRTTVNNSVDEHFSKSLGDLWPRVKGTESPIKHSKDSASSNSVDDHFAKALGDTWFKIKSSNHNTGSLPTSYPVQSNSSPQRLRDMTYHH